jgi:hypothetical protein
MAAILAQSAESVTLCAMLITSPGAADDSANGRTGPSPSKGKAVGDVFSEFPGLDDFQVLAEQQQVSQMITALTERYRELNQEMTRRETLRWMVP